MIICILFILGKGKNLFLIVVNIYTMSKGFTIHSAYHEINGDYLEYDIRDYGEAWN